MPMPTIVRRTSSVRDAAVTVRRSSDDFVWREFCRTRRIDLRNQLVERYLDLARMTAERERSRFPAEVDPDDLRQAAVIALMKAIDKFKPELGIKFETYCSLRLRGGIFDELRSMDWVPRLVRNRTSRMDRTRCDLEAKLGRTPTDEEVRSRMGISEREFRKLRRDSAPPSLVSLDRPCFEGESGRGLREIDTLSDIRIERPELTAIQRDLLSRIGRGLSRSEKLVVVLYYYENLTMREIGDVLDLSESRVSQMHTSIVRRLKAAAGLREDLAGE